MVQAVAWSGELRRSPLPPFYSCGIRFRPEPIGAATEEWVDPYTVKKRGYGDCDDIVIWRLAEILAESRFPLDAPFTQAPAHAAVARKKETGRYHVLIRHANGTLEDPAAAMRDKYGEMPPLKLRRRL